MKKTCTKCKEQKDLSLFSEEKRMTDGHHSWCKSCRSKASYEYNKSHPDRAKTNNKNYRNRHKDEIKERNKKSHRSWYDKNRDLKLSQNKKYVSEHKEERNLYIQQYRLSHPDFIKHRQSYMKDWNTKNPDRLSIYRRNREALERGAEGNIKLEEWNEVLEKYENTCLSCNRNDVKITMDHVVPLKVGGTNTIDNVQPLCQFCNSSKNIKIIDYRAMLK